MFDKHYHSEDNRINNITLFDIRIFVNKQGQDTCIYEICML